MPKVTSDGLDRKRERGRSKTSRWRRSDADNVKPKRVMPEIDRGSSKHVRFCGNNKVPSIAESSTISKAPRRAIP